MRFDEIKSKGLAPEEMEAIREEIRKKILSIDRNNEKFMSKQKPPTETENNESVDADQGHSFDYGINNQRRHDNLLTYEDSVLLENEMNDGSAEYEKLDLPVENQEYSLQSNKNEIRPEEEISEFSSKVSEEEIAATETLSDLEYLKASSDLELEEISDNLDDVTNEETTDKLAEYMDLNLKQDSESETLESTDIDFAENLSIYTGREDNLAIVPDLNLAVDSELEDLSDSDNLVEDSIGNEDSTESINASLEENAAIGNEVSDGFDLPDGIEVSSSLGTYSEDRYNDGSHNSDTRIQYEGMHGLLNTTNTYEGLNGTDEELEEIMNTNDQNEALNREKQLNEQNNLHSVDSINNSSEKVPSFSAGIQDQSNRSARQGSVLASIRGESGIGVQHRGTVDARKYSELQAMYNDLLKQHQSLMYRYQTLENESFELADEVVRLENELNSMIQKSKVQESKILEMQADMMKMFEHTRQQMLEIMHKVVQ